MEFKQEFTPHRTSRLSLLLKGGAESVYGVDAFPTGADTAVVVVTELPCNKGPSVTNAIEAICEQVLLYWLPGYVASNVIWVERYLDGAADNHGGRMETFDLVQFENGKTFWRPLGNRSQDDFWRICFGKRPSHLKLSTHYGSNEHSADED